jgi:hypothetical protein
MIYNNSVMVYTTGTRAVITIREEYGVLRNGYDMKVHNGYTWNNRNSINNDLVYTGTYLYGSNFDPYGLLEEKVDYWKDVIADTKTKNEYFKYDIAANRNTLNCEAQAVYWETDTKKLYRCTSTDTWDFIYQPYQYPHPLSKPLPPRNPTIK